jgi:hypothetical protein
MIRRTFLKALLATPLAGLFKSCKSDASTGLTETTGTSSEGPVAYYDGYWFDMLCEQKGSTIIKALM